MGRTKKQKTPAEPDSQLWLSNNRTKVRVRKSSQAVLPECKPRNEGDAYEGEPEPDVLLWSPNMLPEEVVEAYEAKDNGQGTNTSHVPDSEDALLELHLAGYNIELAEANRFNKKKEEEENRKRFALAHGNAESYDEPFNKNERFRFEHAMRREKNNLQNIIDKKYFPDKTPQELVAYYYRRKGALMALQAKT